MSTKLLDELNSSMSVAGLEEPVIRHAVTDDVAEAEHDLAARSAERVDRLLQVNHILVDACENPDFHA